MKYYLGIDMGTTSTKAVAFSDTGVVLASESVGYSMQHPQPGWSEQNPDEIVQAVISSLNQVVKQIAPDAPAFISFSAAMHSLLAVDDKGNPLTPCIIWADNRAEAVAEQLKESELGQRFYHTTGVPIHSMSPLCKLIWISEQQPELFQTAYKFMGIKEYVFFKLFGEFIVDTSIASATGLLNLKTLRWDEEVLHFIGLTSSRLSTVVPVTFVCTLKHKSGLSIPLSTPVVIGGSDGALSNLGTGATGPHQIAVTIGTSGAARMIVKGPQTDKQMRTFCYHVKDNLFIVGGATNNGAVVVQWLKEALLKTNDTYDELFQQAQRCAPGSQGLLFLPYILGERAPRWNAQACGVYFGLSIQHTQAHLIRSTMEGVVFALYSIAQTFIDTKGGAALYASGGFARSALWLQMVANVFNSKVLVSDTVESAALGAVLLGAEALGIQLHVAEKKLAEYKPDATAHKVYQQCFEKFERLYEALKTEMN